MKKYPKFRCKKECAFPEREDCNYGKDYERCLYMKYDNSKSIFDSTRWKCAFKDFKKQPKTTKNRCF